MNRGFQRAAICGPRTSPSGASGASATLLIVDDLADNRDVLARRFRRQGFEILEASSGADALRVIDEEPVDCVLLDVMMPGLDGMQVLREIRKAHSVALLPVVMVTANCQSKDLVEALASGANDYVTKPIDFSVALARVNSQLERRRAEFALRRANAAIREEMRRRDEADDLVLYLATHDALTGLPNRYSFQTRLVDARRLAAARGLELALLFVDLDGFKEVNDTFGHQAGDKVLKDVAAQIVEASADRNMCARLGGDEFAVLHMSSDARSGAAGLSQKLIDAIRGVGASEESGIRLGASIGIALLSDEESDPTTLLKRADFAMYQAKAAGRGVYRFSEAA